MPRYWKIVVGKRVYVYNHWNDEDVKSKIRINRETFNFVFNENHNDIVMSPTNLNPFQTPPYWQLSMILYRFATGCTYSTLPDLFDVSISAANKYFKVVFRVRVAYLK